MNMMNTKIERVNPEQIDETIMEEAGRLIAEGELVAFPTETVYGCPQTGRCFLAGSPDDDRLEKRCRSDGNNRRNGYCRCTDAESPGCT